MKNLLNYLIYIFSTKHLYFAYGSNMLKDRIHNRIGYCYKGKVISLEGYKLSFNYGNDKYSFANIIEDENSTVEGVMYKLTFKQLMLLHYSEGVGNPNYYSHMIDLYKNKPLHFYISFNTRKEFIKPISKDYYDTLNLGRSNNNLPIIQIDKKNISVENFMYK